MRRPVAIALPALGLGLFLVAWWLLSDGSTSLYFPPLREIVSTLVETWTPKRLAQDGLPSLTRFAVGFAGAVLAGVSLGVVLGSAPRLEVALRPQLELVRSTPPVLLLPPSILLLGTGSGMKVFVIALGSMWPIVLSTATGVRSVDEVSVAMSRVFGLPRAARLRHVVLPSALPSVIAGARSALPIALVLMVVTELVASTNGIGYFILQAQQTFDIAAMWSGVVVLSIAGMLLSLGLAWIDRRVLARISPTSQGAHA